MIWESATYKKHRVRIFGIGYYSPLDIAALQYLYGPSPTARAGDDTYSVSANTCNFIWDGAGLDTVSAEGLSTGVTLYLEPGYWGFVGAKSSLITSAGQITVNFGTVIEKAIGGSGDDQLYGNGVNNEIKGLAGNDVIDGGEGDADVSVYRGVRSDYVVTKTAENTYTVRDIVAGRDGTDTITNVEYLAFSNGKFEVASLVGADAGTTYKWSALTNTQSISFDPARDKLIFDEISISASKLGIVFGGGGSTGVPAYITFTYASKTFTIAAIDFKALTTSNVVFADGSLLLIGDNTVGASADDLANVLNGSSYNDKIYALGGDDTIDGGEGDDWVLYDNSPSGVDVNLATGLARDGWSGANGLLALGGTDHLNNIENVEGSNYGDKLTGNDGDNQFRGLSGDDTIDGGAGDDTAIYRGVKADYVITKLENGSYTVQDKVAGRDGKDTLTHIESLSFSDGVQILSSADTDLNGDHHSDILLQNGDDGMCFTWEMNGLSVNASGVVGWTPPTKDWHAVGTGDFNADGKSDVLLQNGADGMCFVWEMNGLNVQDSGVVGWTPPTNRWHAVGTGDFDGDGKSDILLQNGDDGMCFVWEMNGLTVKDSGVVGWTPPSNAWKVAGVGDFDGDGKSDILLQNGADGMCFVWEMNGLSVKDNGVVGWTPPTADWHATV